MTQVLHVKRLIPRLRRGNKVYKGLSYFNADGIMFDADDIWVPEGWEYINVAKPYSNGNPDDYIGPAFVTRHVNGKDTIISVGPYDTEYLGEEMIFKNTDSSKRNQYEHYKKLLDLKKKLKAKKEKIGVKKDKKGDIMDQTALTLIDYQRKHYGFGEGWSIDPNTVI